jgi:predicted ABC-type ATPase
MSPNLYVIAGPNGAGKTTFAREFLPNYGDCKNFVNADLIAEGVSPFSPAAVAFRAGRLMLEEIDIHSRRGEDFGFETTLSGRRHLGLIRDLKQQGYEIHLFFLWVSTVDLALIRIRDRVSNGGHDVAEPVVRRRFDRSVRNFFVHYRPLANTRLLFDNSGATPVPIAIQEHAALRIINAEFYNLLTARYGVP